MHGGHPPPETGAGHGGADAPDGREQADARRAITRAFVDGFRAAADKQAFLALAGVHASVERDGERFYLVEVTLADRYAVGQVSRGFASAALVHQPLPPALVAAEAELGFAYVGPSRRLLLTLTEARGGQGD
jgi:hypothetical protein